MLDKTKICCLKETSDVGSNGIWSMTTTFPTIGHLREYRNFLSESVIYNFLSLLPIEYSNRCKIISEVLATVLNSECSGCLKSREFQFQ